MVLTTDISLTNITLASWNVRGINHPLKRGKVFGHLKRLKADIIFLQETHIDFSHQARLRTQWISQTFQTTFSSKARGVAILFRKNVPFQLKDMKVDPQGRYIIISGNINSIPLTLVNVYGPNYDNPDFFRNLFNIIPFTSSDNIIIGGDFNCCLDSNLDKLSAKTSPILVSAQILNSLLKSTNLVDIWRLQHPTTKGFSFYSPVHKSFSRIDYFLISSELVPRVNSTVYHPILISDHSPITLTLQNIITKPAYHWKFNLNLLSDTTFIKYMNAKISEFLEFNDTKDVSDTVLWETFKAVTRGHILAFEATKKKELNKRLTELENIIITLEKTNALSPSTEVYNQILQYKFEYNNILNQRVENLLLKLKRKYFELGEKPEGLLARQLRDIRANQAIHEIYSISGHSITNHQEINNRFRDYYSDLYMSRFAASEPDLDSFFNNLAIPKLSDSAREALDSPIDPSEIQDAIDSFPLGKATGPDGFGCEFYKTFSSKLVPLLLRMFNDSIANNRFPDSLYQANISVILKKGKIKTDPASYRPIALLNVDQKIISKVLANRLAHHISDIIHPDQTGFIPGRFSFGNVRLLLNTIHSAQQGSVPAAILSLDAQKAFDQVEWPYMFYTLSKFGFGTPFINLVKALYLHPCSSILTNSNRSLPFPLQRGVRQGDPLSPLLFNLALEPLAIGIRNHPDIHGITINGLETLVNLYADDLLLSISNPATSVPKLLDYINLFGRLSGYTINWNKCEFMPLTNNFDQNFLSALPFNITNEHFTYLGLQISKNPKTTIKLNYENALDKLKKEIARWKLLPLSMIGKINAIKMIILPRYLYLFQNLPFFLPNSFFQLIDTCILSFIWAQKTPRISKTHLQKSTTDGGLNLPNFKHYYWAANARAISFWQLGSRSGLVSKHTTLWVKVEASFSSLTSLPTFLYTKLSFGKIGINYNLIIKNSLKILNQIKLATKAPPTSIHTPITFNQEFIPAKNERFFIELENQGLVSLGDLYKDGCFMSFNDMRDKYNIPQTHFFSTVLPLYRCSLQLHLYTPLYELMLMFLQVGWSSVKDYHTFVWALAPPSYREGNDAHCCVHFQAGYLPGASAEQYQFVYVDGKVRCVHRALPSPSLLLNLWRSWLLWRRGSRVMRRGRTC
uniref:Reverse transcriptase domain-containing protein n=1 Tax=Astyanax mexicanus TaxID=7994 RepID=A0A3B1J7U7_ASTMX